ncbi:MAG: hypothetical protein ACREJQ_06565 [bacterium]
MAAWLERFISTYRKRRSAQCFVLCALADLFLSDPAAYLTYPQLWQIGWTNRGDPLAYNRAVCDRLIDEVIWHINERLRVFFASADEQYVIEHVRAAGYRLVRLNREIATSFRRKCVGTPRNDNGEPPPRIVGKRGGQAP